MCAPHARHRCLSASRRRREDETGVSLCPFARVYRRPVCGKVKHGKSYERGVDPFLPQPGLTEVSFVKVTSQTAPAVPPPPPPPPVIKIPLHRRNRKSIRNHRPASFRVPAVFFSLFFFFFFLSAADLTLVNTVSMPKRKALCHGIKGWTRIPLHWF